MTDYERKLAVAAEHIDLDLRRIHDDLNRTNHLLQRVAVALETLATQPRSTKDEETR